MDTTQSAITDNELLQQIAIHTYNTDLWIRVFLYIVMVGIAGFVAWKCWRGLIWPNIKNFIKFPL